VHSVTNTGSDAVHDDGGSGGPHARRPGLWWRAGLDILVVLAGLALLIWGVVVLADPSVTCRGVEMAPGDLCHKSSYTSLRTDTVQSYEQRRHAVAQSRPTVIVLGAVTTAFGAVMVYRRFSR